MFASAKVVLLCIIRLPSNKQTACMFFNKLVSAFAGGPCDTRPITGTLSVGPTATERPRLCLLRWRGLYGKGATNSQVELTIVVFTDLLTALMKLATVTKVSKSSISDKVPKGCTLIFGVTRISLQHSVG